MEPKGKQESLRAALHKNHIESELAFLEKGSWAAQLVDG